MTTIKQIKEKIKWKHVIIMLLIIGIGLFIINQILSLSYKAILLTDPCELCKQYNLYHPNTFNLNLSELLQNQSLTN